MKQIVFAILFLCATVLSAATWHVSSSGNDQSDGCTEKTAWRTFSRNLPNVKPGDTVLLHGTFFAEPQVNPAFQIMTGGSTNAPVIYRGAPGSVIYGNGNQKVLLLKKVNNVVVENIAFVNGKLQVLFSNNIKFRNLTVTGEHGELHCRYTNNAEITHCIVCVHRGQGITLGSGTHVLVQNNTISCSRGFGIFLVDKKMQTVQIRNNIITGCSGGIGKKDSNIPNENITGNILWKNAKKIQWIQNVATKKEGMNHWNGFLTIPAGNLIEDPQIISFDPKHPKFMAPHRNGPNAGKAGAVKVADWDPPAGRPGENLVINPDFLNGLYGWNVSVHQMYEPVEFQYQLLRKVDCGILKLINKQKSNIQSSVSTMIQVKRGYPLEVRFRAKSETGTTKLSVILTSGRGYIAKQNVKLSTQWNEYKLKFYFPPFCSENMYIKFLQINPCTIYLTGVHAVQNPRKTNNRAIEIKPILPAMIYPENSKITLRVPNSVSAEISCTLNDVSGRLIAFGKGLSPYLFTLRGTGASFLNVSVKENGSITAEETYRLILSEKPSKGKNSHFIGINSPSSLRNPLQQKQIRDNSQACAVIGIGSFHQYLNIAFMRKLLLENEYQWNITVPYECGISTFVTLNDSLLFTGKRPLRIPGPDDPVGAVESEKTEVNYKPQRMLFSNMEIWKKYIAAFSKKYNGIIPCYEICNEPNCYLSATEYSKAIDLTLPILRTNTPGAKIVAGSVVNATRKEHWKKTAARKDIDGFSFHPYRFFDTNPARSGLEYMIHSAFLDGAKNVYLTEEFQFAGPDFETEKAEARAYARILNISLSCGASCYYRHHNLFIDSACTTNLLGSVINTFESLLSQAIPQGIIHKKGFSEAVYLIRKPDESFRKRWAVTGAVKIKAIWLDDHLQPKQISLSPSNGQAWNQYGNPVDSTKLNYDLIYIMEPLIP